MKDNQHQQPLPNQSSLADLDSESSPEIQLKEPPRGCKSSNPFYSTSHKPESMPSLLAKGKSGKLSRPFRLESGDSETSPNNSASGTKVWGDSVLSTNHEAAIDCNGDVDGSDEGDWSDDGITDIRRVAVFNSLKNFLVENNLQIFLGVANRKC